MSLLKHVASVRVSNVDKKTYEGETPIRLCNYTDVYYGNTLRAGEGVYMAATASADQIRNFRLEAGDTVLTKDSETADDIGISAYIAESDPHFVCGYHLAIVRPHDQLIDPRFLFWVSRSSLFTRQLSVSATGVTRFGLRTEVISNVDLPLPTLGEQRQIARFLDEQVDDLDHMLVAQQRSSGLLLERFRSLLAAEVLLSQDSPGVDRTRLKYLFEYERNGIWGSDADGGPDDIACVRVADFDREQFVASEAPTVRSVPRAQRLPRLLRRGDVLLEKSGGTQDKPVGCAVSYMSDRPAVCSNFVAALRPAQGVVPRFAGFVMAALYQTRRNGPYVNQTTGIQNIDGGAYLAQEIWIPGEHEQKAIVSRIEEENARAQQLMRLAGQRVHLLEERKQALITAAVSGQFDVTTARAVA